MTYMEVENHDDFYSFDSSSNQIRVWDQQGVGVVYDSALGDLDDLEQELLTVGSYFISSSITKQGERLANYTNMQPELYMIIIMCVMSSSCPLLQCK